MHAVTLQAYLPKDRLHALARGESLPDRTSGSALFADISGFTRLTEKLTREFGIRRGIEDLTQRINKVYDAMMDEVISACTLPKARRHACCKETFSLFF